MQGLLLLLLAHTEQEPQAGLRAKRGHGRGDDAKSKAEQSVKPRTPGEVPTGRTQRAGQRSPGQCRTEGTQLPSASMPSTRERNLDCVPAQLSEMRQKRDAGMELTHSGRFPEKRPLKTNKIRCITVQQFIKDQRTSEIIQSLLEPQAKDAKYTRVFPHETDERKTGTGISAFALHRGLPSRQSSTVSPSADKQVTFLKSQTMLPSSENLTVCVTVSQIYKLPSEPHGAGMAATGSVWITDTSHRKKEIRSLDKAAMEPPAVKLLLKIQKHSSCEKLILLTYILSFFHLEGRKLKHQQLYRMQFRHQNRDQPALLVVVQKFPGKSSACPSLGSKTYLQKMHRGYKARTQDSIFRSLKIPVENMIILDRREG
ncbi:hypothetical protein MG293_020242 [Ovis ammon polii]|uniref:Uncharacterized protein n=1 Tax=Ovis ammon polii TaxID=230172 RepID=A0AAD4TNW1_OVIAM|nr:hypothetical protein MG293_020242 [Ovis ammon polii]